MFLWKVVLKICSTFIGEHPCCSVILIKFHTTFIKVTFHDGCNSVNCCIFSVHLFIGTPLEDCFRNIHCVTSQKKGLFILLHGTLWNNSYLQHRDKPDILCIDILFFYCSVCIYTCENLGYRKERSIHLLYHNAFPLEYLRSALNDKLLCKHHTLNQ